LLGVCRRLENSAWPKPSSSTSCGDSKRSVSTTSSASPGITRVSTCGELDDALKTAEQDNGAAYIEAITDAYEAAPVYKKLQENLESFYNVQ
jgi:hypothetical protein